MKGSFNTTFLKLKLTEALSESKINNVDEVFKVRNQELLSRVDAMFRDVRFQGDQVDEQTKTFLSEFKVSEGNNALEKLDNYLKNRVVEGRSEQEKAEIEAKELQNIIK